MARLRFKLEINPGGHGVRLDKLGRISERAERFLRNLAEDAGASISPGDLVASHFYDSSFGSTVEAIVDLPQEVVFGFDAGVEAFSHIDGAAVAPILPAGFSKKTLQSYVALGDEMESDEAVRVGLLRGDEQPKWEKLTKASTVLVKAALEEPYRYRGALQGRLGTWYKESAYFNLRELAHGLLVKCNYASALYGAVYGAFEDKDAVVHVVGDITAERLTGEPTSVTVTDIKVYPRLTDAEFSSLAGSHREIVGSVDVVAFIDEMRDDGDD